METPRPIAFLSTMSSAGVCNVGRRASSRLAHYQLSPMSYFNMVSHNPPTIMIGIQASSIHPSGLKG